MNTFSSMARQGSSLGFFGAALLVASALGTTACSSTVIGGSGSETGEGGSSATGPSDGGSTGTGQGGGYQALAVLASEMTWWDQTDGDVGSSGNTTSGSGGNGVDPNMLYIEIANYGQQCGVAPISDCSQGTTWQVSIGIPPALQVPGVLQLSNESLISTQNGTGSNGSNPGGSEDCWGGGGSFIDGTLEIVSIDATQVVVRLSGTSVDILPESVSADGDYTVPRCSALGVD